jgi:hypothetical protein
MVLPPRQLLSADLPVLSPAVAGMLRRPSPLTLLDVGGNDAGATVLSSLSDLLHGVSYRMLQVVNPFRPFTDTMEGCRRIRTEIEKASRLTVDGLVGNPNLIDETTPELVEEGLGFLRRLAGETGLPLEFVAVPEAFAGAVEAGGLSCPVLPIARQLVPPWKRAAAFGGGSFRRHGLSPSKPIEGARPS